MTTFAKIAFLSASLSDPDLRISWTKTTQAIVIQKYPGAREDTKMARRQWQH